MARRPRAASWVPQLDRIDLDGDAGTPLSERIYRAVRAAILEHLLPAGMQLPSTRQLAASLGVARNTVIAAQRRLAAEGYVDIAARSGMRVSAALPDPTAIAPPPGALGQRRRRRADLSRRGRHLAARVQPLGRPWPAGAATAPAFRPGLPALDEFPRHLWSQLAARRAREPSFAWLGYEDPAGAPALRATLARYHRDQRGADCSADQVIVTSGAQQAIDLAVRALLDPGDRAWVEDPGYPGAVGALLAGGARLVPVPVDDAGIVVRAGIRAAPDARLAYVTPSRQWPLGVTMTLERRIELLRWARERDAWIVEDDYDSGLRYAGRPLAALQSIDADGRVLYVGTFSKLLFPGLRLGYLVAPPRLVEPLLRWRWVMDQRPHALDQLALASFFDEGHFRRHVQRMRALYAERQALLVGLAGRRLAQWMELQPSDCGLDLVARLAPGLDDERVASLAAERGVELRPLSRFSLGRRPRNGLVLGYAACSAREIERGVAALADALRSPRS
ncbi:MAG: PLP-dependent aminotransferase family protein [Proteobacteria bacterium]|nr:MAG: PLP-dependent aminotransferase family protein [Pseudomonadota bacterium]